VPMGTQKVESTRADGNTCVMFGCSTIGEMVTGVPECLNRTTPERVRTGLGQEVTGVCEKVTLTTLGSRLTLTG